MSHEYEHVHGSRRLHRALGLGLSGLALVGLVYFEGASARAEADDSVAEGSSDEAELELEELEAEADEADHADETPENMVPERNPVALPPSGPAASPAQPATAPVDGRLAMATLAEADSAALPVAPPAPALVAVPDIEGMSLRKAKKQLAAVGLKLSVRDEYGDKIPREYWSEYKVRKQKLDPGTELAAGSTVKVKARMRMRYAQGY
jgi:beta-lactam-binding protein with PASTA domain